jgi:DNA-binding NarL/FixJ family response regulator
MRGLELPDVALPRVARRRVAVVAGAELPGRRVTDVLQREGFEVVVRATSSAELLAEETDLRADAVVVAVEDVGRGTADALARLRDRRAELPVVVVSGTTSRRAIHDALNAGASGFVSEPDLETRLAPTVRAVQAGQLAVPTELRTAVSGPLISPREKQMLAMVVLGFTNAEIANRLYVVESTVKSHLSSAYRKLGVRSRQEATALILHSSDSLGLGILSLTADRTGTSARSEAE